MSAGLAPAGTLALGARTAPRTPPGPTFAGLLGVMAIGAAPAIILALLIARDTPLTSPWVLVLGAVTVFTNAAIILSDIRYGLALFIVTAALSPKLPGAYDNLRVEDFVFVLVFASWLRRVGQEGRFPRLHTPIVVPFLALTAYSVLATVWGQFNGYILDPKYAIFMHAKRIEYFLIFWVVATSIRSEAWLRLLTMLFVVSGALAAGYGLLFNQQDTFQQVAADVRIGGPEGENYNTLSGYLVICIGTGLAAFAAFRGAARWLMLAAVALATAGLLMAFSREGYIMLFGAVLVFAFTRHRKVLLAAAAGALVIGLTFPPAQAHLRETFQKIEAAPDDDPGSNSLTARLHTWQYRMAIRFQKEPLVGCGVGSLNLSVDSEYVLRLCEVGLLGFGIFLWWLSSIGKQVFSVWRSGGIAQMLGIGLASAFVGMLIQGFVATSFNTIRTMEPFWYLMGLVACAAMLARTARRDATNGPVPCAS